MKLLQSLAIIALVCHGQSVLAMNPLRNNMPQQEDLSIYQLSGWFKRQVFYNNAPIGKAFDTNRDDGSREIEVVLYKEYKNKSIEPYLEELLQRNVNQAKLTNLKAAIHDINPNNLTLGNRLVDSSAIGVLKNGKSIVQVSYADNQDKDSDPVTRVILTVRAEEAFRGQGCGTYLMKSFIEKTRNDNISSIELESAPDAIGFYERLGFIRQGNTKIMILNLK